jgi:hypothetical protein
MGWIIIGGLAFLGLLALLPVLGSRPSRALPDEVCEEIAQIPQRRANQHLVDLELRDGGASTTCGSPGAGTRRFSEVGCSRSGTQWAT